MTTTTPRAETQLARQHPRHGSGLSWWPLVCALALVVAPFLVAAVRVLLTRDATFHYSGDQALISLATHEASTAGQLLGPYSRFGWAHPGPTWFYLLAPATRLFGDDDAALVAANLLVEALFAAVFVAAVHRRERPATAFFAAGLLLLYVLRMPAEFFIKVWNPFALILATAVFLAFAARCRGGRWPTLLVTLVVGSFLVQTHVGTAPLVGAVSVVALVAVLRGRHRRVGIPPLGKESRPRTVWALAALLVLMWTPPVVQQLTAAPHQGNLGLLLRFFVLNPSNDPRPGIQGALTAVGRLLVMAPYGWGPGPFEMDLATLPGAVLLGLLAQAVASLVLVLLGRRWAAPITVWTGVVTFVALLAAVVSVLTVSGTVYWYLLTWVSVIPVVTLAGAVTLFPAPGRLGQPAHRQSLSRRAGAGRLASRPAALAGLAALVMAVAAATAVYLDSGLSALPDSAGVGATTDLVDDSLRGRPVGEVYVDIATHDLWPIGAGLVTDLVDDGWTVRVDSGVADLFGTSRVSAGAENVQIVLISPTDPQLPTLMDDRTTDLGLVDTEVGPMTVLLEIAR